MDIGRGKADPGLPLHANRHRWADPRWLDTGAIVVRLPAREEIIRGEDRALGSHRQSEWKSAPHARAERGHRERESADSR